MSVSFAQAQGERLAKQFAGASDRIDVKAIAESLGIQVIEADLGDKVSGLLVTNPVHVTICVQQSDSPTRKQFTIAHELGHHVLGHHFEEGNHVHVDHGNIISQRGALASQGVDKKEIEANQFAASLLMPSAAVRTCITKLGRALTDADVTELADAFGVSEQAMTIRLTRLRFL